MDHIIIRPAVLDDKLNVYNWLFYSDFSAALSETQGITQNTIPSFEDFSLDYEDYFFDGSSPDKGRSFIIQNDDEEIGHISYCSFHLLEGITEFDIWLKGLDYAGKGRGTKAIQLLAEDVFKKGYSKIIIRPYINNIRAIKAYEKAGFKKTKLIHKNYYKPQFIELYGDGDCGKGKDVFMVLENKY